VRNRGPLPVPDVGAERSPAVGPERPLGLERPLGRRDPLRLAV